MTDRPLRFARDRSVWERVAKWRRRNPRVLRHVTVAGLVATSLGTALVARQESATRAGNEATIRATQLHASLNSLRLDLTLPDDRAGRVRGQARADELLATYGVQSDPQWRRRDAFARLSVADQRRLTDDLGEVLILLTHSRWQEIRFRHRAGKSSQDGGVPGASPVRSGLFRQWPHHHGF